MRGLLALLVIVCLASGCVGPTPDGGSTPRDQDAPDFPSDADLTAPPAAVAEHGPAEREESAVTVTPGAVPAGYTARQTITIRNSLEGFPGAVAEFSTPGGGLSVHKGTTGSYEVVVELRATALTESEARAALATLHVDSTDAVTGGSLHIAVKGRMDSRTQAGLLGDVQRSISIDASLDAGLAYDLAASTGGGGIDLSDLAGPSVSAETGGGGIEANDLRFAKTTLSTGGGGISAQGIQADEVDVQTGGGGVTVEASARTLSAESGGGGVTVDFTPTATGRSTIQSGGGGVTVTLARDDGIAYDVSASSSGGGCTVDIHDAETTGNDFQKHARSRGFRSASIQATVEASSGGGGVTVRD